MNGNRFDKKVPIALYFQLQENLTQKILSREWEPGARIPTEKELCEMYDVSRITVRKALDELEQMGYIVRRQGKGNYVSPNSMEQKLSKFYSFSEEIKRLGRQETAQLLSFEIQEATAVQAKKLGLPVGARLICVRRLRLVDLSPYGIEKSRIPERLLPNMTSAEVQKIGLYKSLNLHGLYPNHAVETLRAVNLSAADAKLLHVKANEAAVNLERVTYADGDVVELCDSLIRGDIFTYTVDLR